MIESESETLETPAETETSPPDVEVSPLPNDVPDVPALLVALETLRTRSHHDTRALYVESRLKEFDAKFRFHDVDVTPAGARDRYRSEVETAYDDERAQEARALRTAIREAESQLSRAVQDCERLRSTAETLPRNASRSEGLLAALLDVSATAAAEARLKGLSARDVRKLFEASSDVRHRCVVLAIEQAYELGQVRVETDADGAELQHLQRLIRARRAARVPEALTEALKQVRAVRQNDVGMALLGMIQEGRRR